MDELTDNQSNNSKPWLFKKGESGNPAGRPKGKTMKEYAREFLTNMSDDDKLAFMNSLSPDLVWRMADGNPAQSTDITTAGKPIPIYGGISIQEHNSDTKDIPAQEEN